jgi:hypothetical protein
LYGAGTSSNSLLGVLKPPGKIAKKKSVIPDMNYAMRAPISKTSKVSIRIDPIKIEEEKAVVSKPLVDVQLEEGEDGGVIDDFFAAPGHYQKSRRSTLPMMNSGNATWDAKKSAFVHVGEDDRNNDISEDEAEKQIFGEAVEYVSWKSRNKMRYRPERIVPNKEVSEDEEVPDQKKQEPKKKKFKMPRPKGEEVSCSEHGSSEDSSSSVSETEGPKRSRRLTRLLSKNGGLVSEEEEEIAMDVENIEEEKKEDDDGDEKIMMPVVAPPKKRKAKAHKVSRSKKTKLEGAKPAVEKAVKGKSMYYYYLTRI